MTTIKYFLCLRFRLCIFIIDDFCLYISIFDFPPFGVTHSVCSFHLIVWQSFELLFTLCNKRREEAAEDWQAKQFCIFSRTVYLCTTKIYLIIKLYDQFSVCLSDLKVVYDTQFYMVLRSRSHTAWGRQFSLLWTTAAPIFEISVFFSAFLRSFPVSEGLRTRKKDF